jgi:gliding motility-associated-like protein
MPNSYAFGNGNWEGGPGNMDILSSTKYGVVQNGNWYVALTAGGSDAISLKLSSPLIIGNLYTISFYDRFGNIGPAYPFQIGLSTAENLFGAVIYNASSPTTSWTHRTFTFTAPSNGQFITIQIKGGTYTSWNHIDNFSFRDCTLHLNLGNDTTLCQGQTLKLTEDSAISYLWSNGSTSPSINVSSQGIYWLKANNGLCSITDSISISINQIPKPKLGNDTLLCKGQTIKLTGDSATTYLWSTGSSAPFIYVSTSGIYWLKENNGTCSSIDSITISLNDIPELNLGNDTIICTGKEFKLNATAINSQFQWQNLSENPIFIVSEQGTYWVKVTNNCGSNYDTIRVDFNNCNCQLHFPNAFTPDNNQLNEQFLPISNCIISNYYFAIFNRWGELLFETLNFNEAWNGTHKGEPVPMGVYIYLVRYEFENEQSKTIHGNVTILR